MAILNFPTSPSLNDTYSFNGKTWVWNGQGWQLQTQGAINGLVIGNATPAAGTFTTLSATGNTTGGNILSGGLISAAGNITGGNLISSSNIRATSAANVTFGDNTWFYSSYTTLNTAGIYHDTGANQQAIQVSTNSRANGIAMWTNGVANSLITSTGGFEFVTGATLNSNTYPTGGTNTAQITATGLTVTGIVSASGNVNGGNVMTGGVVNATGNVVGGNVLTAGLISATGAITGAALTGTSLTVSTGNVTTGNVVNSNANGVGNIGSATTYFNTVFAKATSAQYADLAENYEADAEYAPGTVVMFGGDKEITVSGPSHNTAVAGIISTNPSYLMNSGHTGEFVLPVALTGRVPCQVQGPVKKGTVLVSGVIPGTAMAIDPTKFAPGCVLGKSLETTESNDVVTIEVAVGRL